MTLSVQCCADNSLHSYIIIKNSTKWKCQINYKIRQWLTTATAKVIQSKYGTNIYIQYTYISHAVYLNLHQYYSGTPRGQVVLFDCRTKALLAGLVIIVRKVKWLKCVTKLLGQRRFFLNREGALLPMDPCHHVQDGWTCKDLPAVQHD